jgi:murein DD-endopeptidase MepM/ murein hydrolase activator NlpD
MNLFRFLIFSMVILLLVFVLSGQALAYHSNIESKLVEFFNVPQNTNGEDWSNKNIIDMWNRVGGESAQYPTKLFAEGDIWQTVMPNEVYAIYQDMSKSLFSGNVFPVTVGFAYDHSYYGSIYKGQGPLPTHEGIDIDAKNNTKVHSLTSGTIFNKEVLSDTNVFVFVKEENTERIWVYGHLKNVPLNVGDLVSEGILLGVTNNFNHLHLAAYDLNKHNYKPYWWWYTGKYEYDVKMILENRYYPLYAYWLYKNEIDKPISSPSLAVTPQGYDNMGQILTNMGRAWDQISHQDLENYEMIKNYQAIFINCASTLNPYNSSESLQKYVSGGGALYASDFAIDYIIQAFPGHLEFNSYGMKIGYVQTIYADITDTGLAAFLDPVQPLSKIELEFDLGSWVVVDQVADNVKVYLRGDVETNYGVMADKPLLVSFQYGAGRVVFTSFHNEPQLTSLQEKLLNYMVLIPETSSTVDQIKSYLVNKYPSINIKADYIGMINQDEVSAPVVYIAQGGKDLIFAAGWAGSELKLTVYKPSGQLYAEISDSNPPISIEINAAEPGEWSFTITGVSVPFNNYPYVVLVGQVEGVETAENCPAAPEIAGELLKLAGIEKPGQYIAAVASETKGREAEFKGIKKCEEGYREAVRDYLIILGITF